MDWTLYILSNYYSRDCSPQLYYLEGQLVGHSGYLDLLSILEIFDLLSEKPIERMNQSLIAYTEQFFNANS